MPAVLDRLRRQASGKTDDELRAELVAARAALRSFERGQLPFADVAHRAVDESVTLIAREVADQLDQLATLQAPTGSWVVTPLGRQPSPFLTAATLNALTHEGFVAMAHDAVDRAVADGRLSPLSSTEFAAKRDGLQASVDGLQRELERRRLNDLKLGAETGLERLESGDPMPDRIRSGLFMVHDVNGAVVLAAASDDSLHAWKDSRGRDAQLGRFNCAQDRPPTTWPTPTYTIFTLDDDLEPIADLNETWSP